MTDTLRVLHYREFLKACDLAGKETKKATRDTFRKVGDLVRLDAAERFARYSARSAAGFRTRVRLRGVAVEQSLRKTTGLHPNWGTLQMQRALLPALEHEKDAVEREFEKAIDTVADHFER